MNAGHSGNIDDAGGTEQLYRAAGMWTFNALPGAMFVLARSCAEARLRAESAGLRVDSIFRLGSGHGAEGTPQEHPSPSPASPPPPDPSGPAKLN